MTHREHATRRIRAIPRERLARKIARTGLGVAVVGAALLAGREGWPWYAVLALGGVGFHIISAELVEGAVRWAVGTLRDIIAALTRRNGAPDV